MTEVMAQVKQLTSTIKRGREAETVPTEDVPFCDVHKVHYERHSNAKGSWYSHKTTDGWCNYQGKK
jgi:hypothetical protein